MENLKENELNLNNGKMEILNEDNLKAKYGKIYKFEINLDNSEEEFELYFKSPTTASLQRYIRNTSKNTLQANLDFTKDNIIDEQKEEFENICSKYIGIAQSCANELATVLGFSSNINVKKL